MYVCMYAYYILLILPILLSTLIISSVNVILYLYISWHAASSGKRASRVASHGEQPYYIILVMYIYICICVYIYIYIYILYDVWDITISNYCIVTTIINYYVYYDY